MSDCVSLPYVPQIFLQQVNRPLGRVKPPLRGATQSLAQLPPGQSSRSVADTDEEAGTVLIDLAPDALSDISTRFSEPGLLPITAITDLGGTVRGEINRMLSLCIRGRWGKTSVAGRSKKQIHS